MLNEIAEYYGVSRKGAGAIAILVITVVSVAIGAFYYNTWIAPWDKFGSYKTFILNSNELNQELRVEQVPDLKIIDTTITTGTFQCSANYCVSYLVESSKQCDAYIEANMVASDGTIVDWGNAYIPNMGPGSRASFELVSFKSNVSRFEITEFSCR